MTEKRIECSSCSAHYLVDEEVLSDGIKCPTCGSAEFSELEPRKATPAPDVNGLYRELEKERTRREQAEAALAEASEKGGLEHDKLTGKISELEASLQQTRDREDAKAGELIAATQAELATTRQDLQEEREALAALQERRAESERVLQQRVAELEKKNRSQARDLSEAEKRIAAAARPGPKALTISSSDTPSEPDDLMETINRSPLLKIVGAALAVHVTLLLLLSLGYLGRCCKYRTLHPRQRIAQIKKDEDEASRQSRRDKALADLAKQQAAREQREQKESTQTEDTGEKSPIEKKIEEVSHDRPAASVPSLDFDITE